MAKAKHFPASALTGGAVGSLDAIPGGLLSDGDHAYGVIPVYGLCIYTLNATSGAAESPPGIIEPDDNAGDKRWELANTITSSGAGYPTSIPAIVGQKYIDTTNKRVWEAVGTTSANDWRPTTGAFKDHGDVNSDLTIYSWEANWHRIKVTGPFSLTIAGWLASGIPDSLTIELVNGNSSTITWVVIPKTAGGSGFSLTSSGTDILEISTRDGGASLQLGFQAAEDIK